ncbi:MAG: SLOG family protein [Eubacteriales bacterium]|nr:SLOG family protein [Eubacteriales bacterium]
MKETTCCFSGYRPEKMPRDISPGRDSFRRMMASLRRECLRASEDGYTTFLSGMSRGFDLWAASVVLELQDHGLGIELWAAIAFHGMEQHWEPEWQKLYQYVLHRARHTFTCFDAYQRGCYTVRDRLLVEHSSRMICYYDGVPGGTEYTVNYAKHSGLDIYNLADRQPRLEGFPE